MPVQKGLSTAYSRAGEIGRLSPSAGVAAIVHVHRCPQPIRLTSGTKYCRARNRPSGGSVVSAHADVSSNPRATNPSEHCWIQNEAKWFDRNEIRSRKPRCATDVDSPIQNVPVWAPHQGSADET